jgi:tetratricopeptide (TPR) repeat protein
MTTLGRVYEKKGDWFSAIKFYNDALKINHDYEAAKNAVIRLTTLMN